MTEKEVFKRLKGSKGVPTLPQVLAEVIRVVDQKVSASKDLTDVISKDSALTARLLRIVNSFFYGRIHKISTIKRAVLELGIRATKAIALSSGVYQMFDKDNILIDRVLFWRHSLETAIACREIAKKCSYEPVEEVFVLGLIHDIGLLILESNFHLDFKHIWERVKAGENLIKLEKDCWGTDHARVGKFLLEQWNLPEYMGEAIAQHHDEFSTQGQVLQSKLARIVNLGNTITKFRISRMGQVDELSIEKIDGLAGSLGISPSALAEVQSKTLDMLVAESKLLEVEIGSVTDLLEAANKLIYQQYMQVEKLLDENRKMHEEIARNKVKEAALESLRTITATLSHYINNISSIIVAEGERVQLAISKGKIIDNENIVSNYIELAIERVEDIAGILNELKKLSSFDTTRYTDETSILDIGDQLKKQIEAINKKSE
jgi:HD-like signal output (HDOD) protein